MILFLPLLFSCEKQDNPIVPNEEDQLAAEYLEHWKTLLINRNGLSKSYYNEHIEVIDHGVSETKNGKQFHVAFQVTIDWAVIDLDNHFMIWINDNPTVYPNQRIERNTYLSLAQIDALISYRMPDALLTEMAAVEHLQFDSPNDAIYELRKSASSPEIYFTSLGYKQSTIGYRANGHPYFFAAGSAGTSKKRKVIGELDLYSGKSTMYDAPSTVKEYAGNED
jgi:hypothetical protein